MPGRELRRRVAISGRDSRRISAVERLQFFRRKSYVDRPENILEVRARLAAGKGNERRALRQHPCNSQARERDAPNCSHLARGGEELAVALVVVAAESIV